MLRDTIHGVAQHEKAVTTCSWEGRVRLDVTDTAVARGVVETHFLGAQVLIIAFSQR